MPKYSNNTNLPLSIGVWLATDNYIYPPDDGKKYISATTLLKSIRQIVLSFRLGEKGQKSEDISSRVASRFGTAIHDGIEKSWTSNHKQALTDLGYPKQVVNSVVVNPEGQLKDGEIPVYMEQRFYKDVSGWVVTGQFDFVGDGKLEDFKSTSTFTWTNGTKSQDYIDQGSIYRWGRPDIITQDVMSIQFIFKDWQAFKATDPKYPSAMLMQKDYTLKSVQQTDLDIKTKLRSIDSYMDAKEKDLPLCNDKELWRGDTLWKYYKNPSSTKRATKNYTSLQDANLRFVQDGSIGLVKEVKPTPTACKYCDVFHLCSQKDEYIASGDLKI